MTAIGAYYSPRTQAPITPQAPIDRPPMRGFGEDALPNVVPPKAPIAWYVWAIVAAGIYFVFKESYRGVD